MVSLYKYYIESVMVSVGFEPTRMQYPTDLKSAALDHSAMIPYTIYILNKFLNAFIIYMNSEKKLKEQLIILVKSIKKENQKNAKMKIFIKKHNELSNRIKNISRDI